MVGARLDIGPVPGVQQVQAAALEIAKIACGHGHVPGMGDGRNQQIKTAGRQAGAPTHRQQVAIGYCRSQVKP